MRLTEILTAAATVTAIVIVAACSDGYGAGSTEETKDGGGEDPEPPPPSPTPTPRPATDAATGGTACPACPTDTSCAASGCTGREVASCEAPRLVDTSATFSVTVCPEATKATLPDNSACDAGTLPAASFRLASNPQGWTLQVLDINDYFFTVGSCGAPGGCASGTGAIPPITLPATDTLNIGPRATPSSCVTFRAVFGKK